MSTLLKTHYIQALYDTLYVWYTQIKGVFSSFGLMDLLDIIIVTGLVYAVIRIMRETRALKLIKGIIILAVAYAGISFLGLNASSYVFRTLFSNLIIIIVILFSPEIRNIFEKIGNGEIGKNVFFSIFASGKALDIKKIQNAINEICKSCEELSDTKTGALIVYENKTPLGDIIKSGTIIKAKVTKELLGNLFFNKAPLHDGAVVVRDGEIYSAGCILPLTKRNDVSSDLGTRHRAAIGMSEQSDAFVIVVSEETGYISIAHDGKFERNISTGVLRDKLNTIFVDELVAKTKKGRK